MRAKTETFDLLCRCNVFVVALQSHTSFFHVNYIGIGDVCVVHCVDPRSVLLMLQCCQVAFTEGPLANMGVASSNGFYYNPSSLTYEWNWKGSVWTWHDFYIPDDEIDEMWLLERGSGAWLSDYGDVWHGVEPYSWTKAYNFRRQQEILQQCMMKENLVCHGLNTLLPKEVVEAIIVFRVCSESSPESQTSSDDIAEALAPFQDFLNKMVL